MSKPKTTTETIKDCISGCCGAPVKSKVTIDGPYQKTEPVCSKCGKECAVFGGDEAELKAHRAALKKETGPAFDEAKKQFGL